MAKNCEKALRKSYKWVCHDQEVLCPAHVGVLWITRLVDVYSHRH